MPIVQVGLFLRNLVFIMQKRGPPMQHSVSKVVDLQDSVLHLNCQNIGIDLRLTDNKGTKFFEDFNSSCGKYDIVQMMHLSGHKTQKTFMDYIKLSLRRVKKR